MNFEIDADDFSAAVFVMAAGALAELGEAQVGELAELEADGDEDGVHLDAALALEFEEHVDQAGVGGAAAEHPASAAQDGAGEGLDEASWLFHRGGPHLQGPG